MKDESSPDSYSITIPTLPEVNKKVLEFLRDNLMTCGTSGRVKPSAITEENIHEQVGAIMELDDDAKAEQIFEILKGFVLLATDVEWIADFAVEADKALSKLPSRITAAEQFSVIKKMIDPSKN